MTSPDSERIAARMARLLALRHPRLDELSEDDRRAWARRRAEVDVRSEDARRERLAFAERSRAAAARPRRPRTISDVRGAMDTAIRHLRTNHMRLTWPAVAERIREDHNLDSLDEKTLRTWAKAEHLPKPWEWPR